MQSSVATERQRLQRAFKSMRASRAVAERPSVATVVRTFLPSIDEVLCAEADIARNDPDVGRCHIAPTVIRYRGRTPIGVPKLLMGTALADLNEAETGQDGDHDARTQRGDASYGSRDVEGLCSHEGGFELRLAIFAEEVDDFEQVGAQLIERRTLRMGARPAGYVPNKKAGVPISLDYRSVRAQGNSEEDTEICRGIQRSANRANAGLRRG